MKRRHLWIPGLFIVGMIGFAGGLAVDRSVSTEASAGGKQVLYYTCPMHPQYKSDEPGDAPCCGMRLVPVFAGADGMPDLDAASDRAPAGTVRVSVEKQQVMGVRVEPVSVKEAATSIRAIGRVAADETRVFRVNAAVNGWIRKVGPYPTGSLVKKGDTLATYYSPEFLNAQQAYFYSLGTRERLLDASLETQQGALIRDQVQTNLDTLENLGMSRAQIDEITRTRVRALEVRIVAPTTGFILSRNITEGQRFGRNDEFFTIADLRRVWVLVDLFEQDPGLGRPGEPVLVRYRYETFEAKVSTTLPIFDGETRTMKVRLELENPRYVLRPDMFVDVEFPVELPPSLTVPVDAIIDTGLRQTVFVERSSGMFEPRRLETGWRYGDHVQVLEGLEPGERVVVSGTFLIDSESRMKAAAAGFYSAPEIDPVCGMEVDPGKAEAAGRLAQHGGETYYFCSDDCKRRFEADPHTFLPAHEHDGEHTAKPETRTEGEPAATGSDGKAIDPVCGMLVDEEAARRENLTSEHDGRTHYFCNEVCKKAFDAAPHKYPIRQ